MKKGVIIVILSCLMLTGSYLLFKPDHSPSPPRFSRPVMQYPLNPDPSPVGVPATQLPEFTFSLQDSKFDSLLQVSKNRLHQFVEAKIINTVKANSELNPRVDLDKNKRLLNILPPDEAGFRPGMYRLSLKLRTLEGEVDITQDFSWGVIAVNTNKSVYHPDEKVRLGMAVLNDNGETLCLTGSRKVDYIDLEITDPGGQTTTLSSKTGTITDSGECGPTTFTHQADFQASYNTSGVGIYQMRVTSSINGKRRYLTDYFKVEDKISFDIERTSFPTRIYPDSPYPVTFTVISDSDFQGLITDTTPNSFHIEHVSDSGVVEKSGDFNFISWYVDLKAGVPKEFTYFIKFPRISPEFYLLGPISIGNFKEARQWQIASDAINSTSGLATWEDNGGNFTWARIWTGTAWSPPLPTPATVSMSTAPGDSRWFTMRSNPKTGGKTVVLVDNVGPDRLYCFTWSGSAWSNCWSPTAYITLGSSSADVTRPFDMAYEELSGDALLVYSDYSSNQLLYRRQPRGGSWDSSSSNAGTAYDVYKRWVRLEPQLNSDSILVGYLNNNERVGAMIWDGNSSTFGDQFSDASGTATATSDEQAFDIAWETSSGTPMIFWGTTANALVYREFTSGTWQAEANATTGLTNDLDWVRAASNPDSTSNDISLGIQQGTTCVISIGVWTGSSATMDGTTHTCPSVSYNSLVDTKFENTGGKAMWVFITSGSPNQMSWRTWTNAGGFTSITTETGSTTQIEGIQLYSDLNSTAMITLYHDNSGTGSDCQLRSREWDGTSWSSVGLQENAICASGDNDTMPYGFGFDRNLETLAAYRWFAANNGTSVVTALAAQDTPFTLSSQNQQFRLRLLLYYPDSLTTAAGRQYDLQYVDPGTGTCASPTGGTPSTWTDVPASGGTTISFYDNGTPADGDNLTANAGDPTYLSYTVRNQDYEEANSFTNSVTDMAGDEVGKWDFSLVDNTTYDRTPQTYCFRVVRSGSTDLPLRIGIYPQITTAAVADVIIQGGTLILPGVRINKP